MTTATSDDDERLLTIRDVADRLNTSTRTVRRRIEAGELAVIRDRRLLRIRPVDLNRYISQRRHG